VGGDGRAIWWLKLRVVVVVGWIDPLAGVKGGGFVDLGQDKAAAGGGESL
jgi:hypothetical protein